MVAILAWPGPSGPVEQDPVSQVVMSPTRWENIVRSLFPATQPTWSRRWESAQILVSWHWVWGSPLSYLQPPGAGFSEHISCSNIAAAAAQLQLGRLTPPLSLEARLSLPTSLEISVVLKDPSGKSLGWDTIDESRLAVHYSGLSSKLEASVPGAGGPKMSLCIPHPAQGSFVPEAVHLAFWPSLCHSQGPCLLGLHEQGEGLCVSHLSQTRVQWDLVCESGAPGPHLAPRGPDSPPRFTPSCPALSAATCARSSSPCRPSWTSSCCCSSSWSFLPSLVSPCTPGPGQPLNIKSTVEGALTLTALKVQKGKNKTKQNKTSRKVSQVVQLP